MVTFAVYLTVVDAALTGHASKSPVSAMNAPVMIPIRLEPLMSTPFGQTVRTSRRGGQSPSAISVGIPRGTLRFGRVYVNTREQPSPDPVGVEGARQRDGAPIATPVIQHPMCGYTYHMRKAIGVITLGGAFAVASFGTVSADQIVVDLPQRTILDSQVGTVHSLATYDVAPEHQGLVCSGDLVAQNNHSVHPGNDIRVATGSSTVVLPDVEGSPDKVTPLSSPLTLGSRIDVDLIMGPDGVFSGAFRLELQCEQPAPPPPPAPVVETVPPAPSVESEGAFVPATVPPAQAPPVVQTPPPVVPTAVAPTSGIAPQVASAGGTTRQLPATGPDRTDVAVALGALLVGAGLSLTALSRRTSGA
jgi:LPXTG-motif cell wall-anchored protein